MKKYTVIDLFSGCGGISEGFKETGRFEIVGGVEFDELASKTFKYNFPNSKAIHGDITKIDVKETGFQDVDVIVGGPPCQGFSALNRWNKDLEEDPRNKLFYEFLRFVSEIKPKAILIENVRQILTSKDGYARKKICELLENMGYNVCYSVLDSSDYGVPQNRKRAFFVGIKKEIGNFEFESMKKFYQPKVTVEDALSDIYDIEEVAKTDTNGYGYKLGPIKSEYQKVMRDGDELNNHFIYYPVQSVQDKMKFVPEGGNWKNVPENMFKTQRSNRHSNYLKRLDSKSQSITIDTGHNVYFHPKYDRVPTVRESARIQSFPDKFTFLGNKGQQLRQVGNAVPPLLAKALASGIAEVLDNQSKYKLLDVFCGAGGLSLGFESQGFESVLAIDFCDKAIETYNFNRENKVGITKDIKEIDEEFLRNKIDCEIDGLVGGPPCQGFSTAGRRIIDDERNELYRDYFKILNITKPKFFLMENVSGILTMAGGLIKEDIIKRGQESGYKMFYDTLLASDYGIPQNRKRVFFIGIREDLYHGDFKFPEPTGEYVTVEDAISDLPSLDNNEDNTKYSKEPMTDFQKMMRGNCNILSNHEQTAHTDETKKLISAVPEGGSIKDLPEELRGGRKYNGLLRRMDRNKPSHTIDTGHRTYFHYEEKRIHSVREGARLQTFKDDYVFKGSKVQQYKQVGNAVPPLFGEILAKAIRNYLEGKSNIELEYYLQGSFF